MKYIRKISLYTLLLCTVMSVASCDVHHWPYEEIKSLSHTLTLTFETDAFDHYQTVTVAQSEKSRAVCEIASHNLRYIIRAYKHDPKNTAPGILSSNVMDYHESVATFEGGLPNFSIPLNLESGEYDIVAWCEYLPQDFNTDFYHNTADFYELAYNNIENSGYKHQGNNYYREAWRGNVRIVVDEIGQVTVDGIDSPDVENVIVKMERPMARFHFVATDLEQFKSIYGRSEKNETKSEMPLLEQIVDAYAFKIRYTGYMPSHMNILSDKTVNSAVGIAFECSPEMIDEEKAHLGFDYVFVGKTDTSVQVALDVYRKSDGKLITSTGSINAPLRRGHYTVITGQLLTGKVGAGVGIDPKFDGDYIIDIF